MKMLKINIKTGNEAYSDENENITYEGRYALRADLNKIAEDIANGKDYGSVIDINGNKVGEWELR